MTVYVIQRPQVGDDKSGKMIDRYDLGPAEKFGELEALLSPVASATDPEQVIKVMRKKLKNFCDDDYLLLIGNPCLIGFATAIAADVNAGEVSMLQWAPRLKKYFVVKASGLVEFD